MNWEVSETVEQESDKFKRWIKESIQAREPISFLSYGHPPIGGGGGGGGLREHN